MALCLLKEHRWPRWQLNFLTFSYRHWPSLPYIHLRSPSYSLIRLYSTFNYFTSFPFFHFIYPYQFSCTLCAFHSTKIPVWNVGNSTCQKGRVRYGYTDPTQATARFLIVLASRIQRSRTEDNNLSNGKGHFSPTDRNDRTFQSRPTTFKDVPNILVGPNRNGPFDFQPKFSGILCWIESAPYLPPLASLHPLSPFMYLHLAFIYVRPSSSASVSLDLPASPLILSHQHSFIFFPLRLPPLALFHLRPSLVFNPSFTFIPGSGLVSG